HQLAEYQSIRISGKNVRNSSKNEHENHRKSIAGFEKLWVWQKAHQLMVEVHDILKKLPYHERFKIKDQLDRSSTSVPDNIAEGHTSYYYQDKIKAFNVARKESGESQNHIRTLQAREYITEDQADDIVMRYEEVIRGINGYINWVREKKGARK
ncbi:MAG: four helix bundle protein, partial [Thermodesulfobacteriota bacterium]